MNIRFDKYDHWASTESRVQLLKLYRKYIIKIKLCASLSINNVSIETNVFAFQTVFVLCRSFVLFFKRLSHKNDGREVEADAHLLF